MTSNKIVAIVSGFQKPDRGWDEEGITKPMKEKFINFMVKDSPWSSCFFEQSADRVLDKGSWLLDTKVGGNLLASAAFATRLISEFPVNFRAWDILTNLGVGGAEAYLMSMQYGITREGGLIKRTLSAHIPFHDSYEPDYFRRFVKCHPINPGEPYVEKPRYTGVSALWGNHTYTFNKYLERIVPRDGGRVKNLDIFHTNKKSGAYVFKTDEEIVNLAEDVCRFMELKK